MISHMFMELNSVNLSNRKAASGLPKGNGPWTVVVPDLCSGAGLESAN